MEIVIKDNKYELDLGIGFALSLDKEYKTKQKVLADVELEFGLGVGLLVAKLESVSLEGILQFFDKGLKDVKTVSYSQKDLQKAVEKKAIELGGFDKLSKACVEALKEVGLYNYIFEEAETIQDDLIKKLVESGK